MKKYLLIFFSLITISFLGLNAQAADFDPDYLISDNEITDYKSMDLKDIQRFLDNRKGTLKNYNTVDKENNPITAAETFYQTANKWLINPKYLLVLVQKEQGLLENESPKTSQYDWATGYGCPDGGGCNPRWQGFYRQVNSAAAQTRYYMDNIHEYYYQPNKTYTIDSYKVTPKNIATAGLYSYTPHVDCDGKCGGNKLFWNLWNTYFGKKWPDGSLLQSTNNDTVYYIENGQKRAIISNSILISRFNPKKIITVSQDDINSYEDGVPIKYLNFSILETPDGNLYMLVDGQKRQFENRELFDKIGFKEDEIIKVTQEDIALYAKAPNITKYTIYPSGKLLQNKADKALYYVISGIKKPVINQEILKFNFSGMTVQQTDNKELDKYRSGNPVTLPEGELIKTKTENTVYVISNGKRLPIFNSKIFQKMNYSWNNITVVSQETLNIHPLGQTITGDW